MNTPRKRQAMYYAETAHEYDARHLGDAEHNRALEIVSAAVAALGLESLLDVGTGTGRALKYLAARHPSLELKGIEPVPELARRAVSDHGIDSARIDLGSGESLPYGDRSFDAVVSFGVLHHVQRPGAVIDEMLRVARRAIFISDNNRFGHGRTSARIAKLALAKAGLWPIAVRIKTRGRDYMITEGDGLAYSYSVYDDLHRFSDWATSLQLIATDEVVPGRIWLHPLLTSPHVLLCALRP